MESNPSNTAEAIREEIELGREIEKMLDSPGWKLMSSKLYEIREDLIAEIVTSGTTSDEARGAMKFIDAFFKLPNVKIARANNLRRELAKMRGE